MAYKYLTYFLILICCFSCDFSHKSNESNHTPTPITQNSTQEKQNSITVKNTIQTTGVKVNYDSLLALAINHKLEDFPQIKNLQMIKDSIFHPLSNDFINKLEGVPLFCSDDKDFHQDEYTSKYYLFMMNDSLRNFKEIIILAPSRVEEIFYKSLYSIVLTQDNKIISMSLIGSEISEFIDFQLLKHKQSIYPRSVKNGNYELEHLKYISEENELGNKTIKPKFPQYISTTQHLTLTNQGFFIDKKEPAVTKVGDGKEDLILEYPPFTLHLDSMYGGDTYFIEEDTVNIYFSDMDDGFQHNPANFNITFKDSLEEFFIYQQEAYTLFFNNDGSGGVYTIDEIPIESSETQEVLSNENQTLFFINKNTSTSEKISQESYDKADAYVLQSKDESAEDRRGYYSSYFEGISHTSFIISYTKGEVHKEYVLIFDYSYGD